MAAISGKADYIIEDIAGCGRFQVLFTFLVMLVGNIATSFTMNLMAFGSYNPGWKCPENTQNGSLKLQNDTSTTMEQYNNTAESNSDLFSNTAVYSQPISTINSSDGSIEKTEWYMSSDDSIQCPIFDKCSNVVFNPESVTIVSEWSLICDRGWIPSFITSLQMVGVLVGCLVGGHCGGRFGRKRTLYTGLAIMTVINMISAFSSLWEVFTIFRFFLGICTGIYLTLQYVYSSEFFPKKWRIVVESLPFWAVNSMLSTLISMTLKDWRHIQIITAIIGFVGLLPAIWLPESLRWLEIKNYNERFKKEALKVVKMNGKTIRKLKDDTNLQNEQLLDVQVIDTHVYDFRALFKKEYRKMTIFLSMPWVVVSLVTYGIFFGIRVLRGNFYLNLILLDIIVIIFSVVPITLPNIIGRKRSSFLIGAFSGFCFLGAACFELFGSNISKEHGVSACVFAGFMAAEIWWVLIGAITLEVYPTVIRSLGTSWGNSMARAGAMLAPFVIPSDPFNVYISYLIVGVISVLVTGFVFKLPETNNIRLKDVYDVNINDQTEA